MLEYLFVGGGGDTDAQQAVLIYVLVLGVVLSVQVLHKRLIVMLQ